MNNDLELEFLEKYRAKASATDKFVYSSLSPLPMYKNNYLHEGPGSVTTERLVQLHLPEKEYQRLCQNAYQDNFERELRSRHNQVYVAWHQYQMMLQLYR